MFSGLHHTNQNGTSEHFTAEKRRELHAITFSREMLFYCETFSQNVLLEKQYPFKILLWCVLFILKILCRKKREKNVQRAKRRKERNAYSSSHFFPWKEELWQRTGDVNERTHSSWVLPRVTERDRHREKERQIDRVTEGKRETEGRDRDKR